MSKFSPNQTKDAVAQTRQRIILKHHCWRYIKSHILATKVVLLPYPSFLFVAMTTTISKSNLREEKIYMTYASRSWSVTEGSTCLNSRQKP